MTTTQSFLSHNLSIDVDGDKMEMATSPYPDPHDNDNDDDIDFELDDQREHSIEDNSMIDDNTENMETNPENDDVTFYENDDELIDFDQDLPMDPDQSFHMHDPNIEPEDDHQVVRLDYHDHSLQDATFEDAVVVESDTNSRENEMGGNGSQEEATNLVTNTEGFQPDDRFQPGGSDLTTDIDNEPHVTSAEETTEENHEIDVKDFAIDAVSANIHNAEPQQTPEEQETTHGQPSIEFAEVAEADEQTTKSIETLAAELDGSTEQPEDGVEALDNNQANQSSQREVTPVVLHPVTIRYNGEDCWLFPPLENADGRHVFLEDATLASEPFDRLLAALRSGLVNDEEMADHDELVLDVPVLGLHICEDSKHASLMNLSRVIDIYMMLSQNEGLTMFEPLYCELSTRVCLADQFAYVDDAAFVRRITYTDFVAEQAGSPEEVTDEHHEKMAEFGDAVVEEQIHADISTYYEAADDHANDAEEQEEASAFDQANIQDVGDQSIESTETSYEVEHEQAGAANSSDVTEIKGNTEIHSDEVEDSTHSPARLEAEVEVVDEVVDARQQSPKSTAHHVGSPHMVLPMDDNEEKTDETSGQVEHEADEDLFANDAAEVDFVEQATDLDDNDNKPESLPTNDDFDFDTWSDDEEEATKSEVSPDSLATPSKGVNGKRKLLDEEDDFLDLDISTPEPKRTRQS